MIVLVRQLRTTETRTHNSANQLTGMGSSTLTFDSNGNTTTDDHGNSLTYDAWNRLVAYTDGGSLTVICSYDGLNRRITQTQPAEDPTPRPPPTNRPHSPPPDTTTKKRRCPFLMDVSTYI